MASLIRSPVQCSTHRPDHSAAWAGATGVTGRSELTSTRRRWPCPSVASLRSGGQAANGRGVETASNLQTAVALIGAQRVLGGGADHAVDGTGVVAALLQLALRGADVRRGHHDRCRGRLAQGAGGLRIQLPGRAQTTITLIGEEG